MSVPTDPSRRGSPRRPAAGGGEPISSAGRLRSDISAYSYPVTQGWREPMIRRAAYLRSLSRGFRPGHELEDWLAAEREIDDLAASGAAPYR